MLVFYLSMIETEKEKSKFAQLYELYRNPMYIMAQGILRDEQLAEDAVHNAFIKIMRYLETIDEDECHKTKNLIVMIIRSTAIDLYRKRKRQSTVRLDEAEMIEVHSEMDAQTDLDSLKETIKALPDKQRDVLELKFFYHYTNAEIAKLLSISEETVRKRLERARGKLRILWEAD